MLNTTQRNQNNITMASAISKGSCVRLVGSFEFNDSFKRFIVENKEIREISMLENNALQKFLENEYMNHNCFNKVYEYDSFHLKFDGWLVNIKNVGLETWNKVIVTTQGNIDHCQKNQDFDFVHESLFLHGCEKPFNENSNSRLVRRCISTYGYIEHTPNIGYFDYYLEKYIGGEEYIVIDISDGVIPNQKPRCTGNNGSKFLKLEPKRGLEENEKIFWYIDQTYMTVNQYEDGFILENLKEIIVL